MSFQTDNRRVCSVFLFGDLSSCSPEQLRDLLHEKGNSTLRSFFSLTGHHLRKEIGSLPALQQEWFPRFTTVIDLLEKSEKCYGSSAIAFSLLCASQIGQFIRHFSNSSPSYPDAARTYVIGPCAGGFAAAAISASRSLSNLVIAGVEAVLVAFRTALCSLEARAVIEPQVEPTHKSWSAIFGANELQATSMIDDFCSSNNVPQTLRPYLSAVTPNNVTISGSPSVLKRLFASSSKSPRYLPIESPYHSTTIFSAHDIDHILYAVHNKDFSTRSVGIPMISSSSTSCGPSADFQSLLRTAIMDTLCRQIRWDSILETAVHAICQHDGYDQCSIWTSASNAGPILSSGLKQAAKIEVEMSDLHSRDSAGARPAHTGKFEDSKIAIVGFSGRFPEAESSEAFWELLRQGKDVHREIPKDRFDWKTHYDPTGKTKNTSRVKYGCFINEPGLFDARFFDMSPRESANTDPAQRLVITSVYEAMEMAGMVLNRTPSTQQDRIGVFFGTTSDDWREVNSGQDIDTYFIPGGNRAFVPGRISYFFRFSGPSISMDTACSSSFASIQTACTYLWCGDCDTAVAGGTNVLTNPDNFAGLDRGHFLSTTGNCNAFDDGASGYCRADAVGSVILKRLEDAQVDNDPIWGIIEGANTNHCGQTDSITRPHEGDQTSVFKRVMRYANVNPLDISYVEMHGTGTQAGDATEMKSVLSVFAPGHDRAPQHPLYIGSAKANVGHAESASGVSSLIKVLMMMNQSEIPPHCGIKTNINHNYPPDLKERNVHIASQITPWRKQQSRSGKRRAFLNNFSAAGGNTALLLSDKDHAPNTIEDAATDPRSMHAITITAKSVKALQGNLASLVQYLADHPSTDLSHLSYTTTSRRMHHSYRTIVLANAVSPLINGIQQKINATELKPIPRSSQRPNVGFAFTGQGTFYLEVAKSLYQTIGSFRRTLWKYSETCERQGFKGFLGAVDGTLRSLDEVDTCTTHLALVGVQMALADLWASYNITPSFAIGHSLGEYAALYAAGVLTPHDTLYLVGSRAQLLVEHCRKGTHTMVAVKASVALIQPMLDGTGSEIACINQSESVVVSGPKEDTATLLKSLAASGLEARTLDIPYAFHSAQIEPILSQFGALARPIRLNRGKIPYLSPLLKRVVTTEELLSPAYFPQASRAVVDFRGALDAAKAATIANDQSLWIEIGPHPTCSGMIKDAFSLQTKTITTLKKDVDPWKTILACFETLYTFGFDIDWVEYHREVPGCQTMLQLPRYSWDVKNYWIDYRNDFCLTKGDPVAGKQLDSALVTVKKEDPFLSPSVQRVLEEHQHDDRSSILIESDLQEPSLSPVLKGHKVNGICLCPSSLYIDMAITVAKKLINGSAMATVQYGLDVGDAIIGKSLVLSQSLDRQLMRISATVEWALNKITTSFYSVSDDGKKTIDHATFTVRITRLPSWLSQWKRNAFFVKDRIAQLHTGAQDGEVHRLKRRMAYKLFSSFVDYDAAYQGMHEVYLDAKNLEATATISLQVDDEGFAFNPRWVDSFGHIAGFVMNSKDTDGAELVFVNHGWDAFKSVANFRKEKFYTTYNRMENLEGNMFVGDTYILEDGEIVGMVEGVKFQGIPRTVIDHLLPRPKAGKQNGVAQPPKPVPAKNIESAPELPAVNSAAVPKMTSASSTMVSRVMSILAEEAGIELGQLEPASEFADFGIDSLMSLTVSGRIQEEVGMSMPSAIFAQYPTVEDLRKYIESQHGPEEDSGTSTPSSDVSAGSQPSIESAPTEISLEPDDESDAFETTRQIMAEEIGVAIEDLKAGTSLLDLGVDSLLGLNINSRLREALDMDIPLSLLADCDTLNKIMVTLGLANKAPSKALTKPIAAASKDDLSAVRSAPPYASSVLLQGSPKACEKTIFLFPDGAGSAASYAGLAQVSPSIAVVGLNCPWLKKPQDMADTIEEMAAKYLTEIRRRVPTGPYYLAGWSAGGIVAYEAAQQLAKAGEQKAQLILLDAPNPIGLENPPERMYDFFESIGLFGQTGSKPPDWLRPHFGAFIRALDRYKPQPLKGEGFKAHIVYARDGICKNPGDPRPEVRDDDPREMRWLLNNRTDFKGEGWTSLVGKGKLSVDVLDEVNHFTLVQEGGHAEKLAAFFGKAVE